MEMNVYAGMFLAELNADYGTQATSILPWMVSTMMVLFGLFLASFPDENPNWMPWSRSVNSIAQSLIPNGGEVNRYVVSLGTTFFVFGVFFSRDARRLLSHPVMNFLGHISFPIYLIHNTLIRTVLSWLLYLQSLWTKGLDPLDAEDKPTYHTRGGILTFAIAMPIFYISLIFASHLWTVYVDPQCEKLVSGFAKKAFGDEDPEPVKGLSLNGILKS